MTSQGIPWSQGTPGNSRGFLEKQFSGWKSREFIYQCGKDSRELPGIPGNSLES
jgi:hypothetical protein